MYNSVSWIIVLQTKPVNTDTEGTAETVHIEQVRDGAMYAFYCFEAKIQYNTTHSPPLKQKQIIIARSIQLSYNQTEQKHMCGCLTSTFNTF